MKLDPPAFLRMGETWGFDRIHKELHGKTDFGYAMIDGTIVQAHRKALDVVKTHRRQTIDRLRGGLTTQDPGVG